MSKFGDLIGRKKVTQNAPLENTSSLEEETFSIEDVDVNVEIESNKVVNEIVLDIPKQVKQKNSWKKMKKNKS